MNKQSNSLITLAMTGIGFGIPITLICMTLIGGFNGVIKEFLIWTVASALYGILSGVILNEKNDLNLPTALVLHCLGCFVVTIAAGGIIGYANNIFDLIKGILPVFIIVYVLVYAIIILIMKKEEKKINAVLNQK